MCTLMVWKRKGASRVSQLIPSCDSYSRSCARSTGGESMFYFSKVLLSFVVVMVGIIFECVILSFIVFVSGGGGGGGGGTLYLSVILSIVVVGGNIFECVI